MHIHKVCFIIFTYILSSFRRYLLSSPILDLYYIPSMSGVSVHIESLTLGLHALF